MMEARLLDENTNLGPNVRAAPASADSPRVPASPVVARPVIAAERRGARNSAGALPTCLALACIPALFFALIIALPWEGPLIHELHRNTTLLEDDLPLATPTYTRSVEHFHSHGTRCGAWLYLPLQPTAAPPPPVIVMAHGMGVQKDMGLHTYADAFANAGMAVFAFDYRTFGSSDGEPRQWVSPSRHVQDYLAAVRHVQASGLDRRVDPQRIALWGVSFSGGHSLVVASKLDGEIEGVVANEPFLSSELGLLWYLSNIDTMRAVRLLAAAVSDELRRRLGLAPLYIKLVGNRDELCLLELEESELSKKNHKPPPRQGGWQNIVLARILAEMGFYHPYKSLPSISCPVFFRAATRDELCPIDTIRKAAKVLGDRATVVERDTTHLGAHKMGGQPSEMAPVLDFLRERFKMPAAAIAP